MIKTYSPKTNGAAFFNNMHDKDFNVETMLFKSEPESTKEFTPKRSAFYEQMRQDHIFPFYNPFYDNNLDLPNSLTELLLDPPSANRGVTDFKNLPPSLREQLGLSDDKNYQPVEKFKTIAVGTKSNYKLVRVPTAFDKPASFALIDWVNFTFKKPAYIASQLYTGDFSANVSDDTETRIIADLSRHLVDILGYGVTEERDRGNYHYERAFNLGKWGRVYIGGQKETVMVELTGQGLLAAKQGWQQRLHDFLASLPTCRLTRVDLAHDNFNSLTSLNDYMQMYLADLFTLAQIRPKVRMDGDWINENAKGRTLYIGARDSGKYLRIYEKGHQLGGEFSDMFPNWIRVELQYGNKGRDLPFDILLKSGAYLAGGYPALANLYKEQEVIETKKKSLKTLFDKAIEVTRHQFGKYIYAISSVFGIEQAFQILTDGKEELPEQLDQTDYNGFDKESYLLGLNISFKKLEELSAALGFGDSSSFLNYHNFKFNPVPF